ncbi:hypothetical protein SAMD00019534_106180 [Acytostelium subglobosum LB1]|uniref:hypothetical protein n=1 Tax=Acytostelium subglobosum LB1 TaxID=1410327 RepID=UPI000644DB01|nr:hypothetical protein SAMD00019534_106180 [Acytostelium subglobosum LB1]GAM27442.1 hypothetical protein SAMD00019534_106180 [Acytostelium subglobosum LB1]|eukprot:XP_012749507.1 hypothetical protein SAMD00019534_106180 [Acytostelium subglobosum LB1]
MSASFNGGDFEETGLLDDGDLLAHDDSEVAYDDDETFGDVGPLNDEWEQNHTKLSDQHEHFVSDKKIRDNIVRKDLGAEDDDEEDELNGNDDDDFGHQSNNQQASFFNLPPPSHNNNVTKTPTGSRTVGMFSSLSINDSENAGHQNHHHRAQADDEQLESMFKMAMGENYRPPPATSGSPSISRVAPQSQPSPQAAFFAPPIVAAAATAQPSSPAQAVVPPVTAAQPTITNVPLTKLFQMSAADQSLPKSDTLKGAISVDQIEAKLESQSKSPITDDRHQHQNQQQQRYNNRQHRNDQRIDRGMPLGNFMAGNADVQRQLQQIRDHEIATSPSGGSGVSGVSSGNHSPRQQHHHHQQSNGKSPKPASSLQDKKYMTADEIQNIHRLQTYQIHFTNPYIEDYYCQKLKISQPSSYTHTPICDSLPKTIMPARPPRQVDPLLGSLGRIPSHSIRAPRPILQIILDKEDNEQYDKTVQSSDQTIKLAIESSYNHLLDLEDIDTLIKDPQSKELLAEYQTKREQISLELFKSLHLDQFPCFKSESPQLPQQLPDQKWPSVCPEDLLFVSLWVIGKGRKLLSRAFMSLTPQQSVSGLFAVCRNLPLLLLLHLPEGSEAATGHIYSIVARWIMMVPVPFFTRAFHFLVTFNQSQFIVKLFQSPYGITIIDQFLTRGYLAMMNNEFDQVNHMQWVEVFGRFFQRCCGNFSTIFPSPKSARAANHSQQTMAQLANIHGLIQQHSNDSQRNTLHLELHSDYSITM